MKMETTKISTDCSNSAGGPLGEPFDNDQAPGIWRHMANENLMFPLDMQDIALKIGPQRQLFVDNELIGNATNVTRQVHPPVRYAANPIFKANGNANAFVITVIPFDESPRFRMWYCSNNDWHPWKPGQEIRNGTSYAVSEDGIHWERPRLDLHQIPGSEQERNIVIPYGPTHGVFYVPDEPDSEKRFKCMTAVELRKTGQKGLAGRVVPDGYRLHTSPDGIHWQCESDFARPQIPSLQGSYMLPQNGIGDTTRFWWDPIGQKYVGDVKFVLPVKNRSRGMMESDDLIHWSRPHGTFSALNPNHEIYGHTGIAYEGMYIGFRWIYDPDYLDSNHCVSVELDCSRDRKHWTRVGTGQPFMAKNPRRDTWDCDMAKVTSLLVIGDEIWIYYAAHTGFMSASQAHTGLAKLRLDGFASINGGQTPGTLRTRPLCFAGNHLHLNAEVLPGGEIRAGFLSADGTPVPGLSPEDCQPIEGDGLDIQAMWKSGSDISALSNTDVRIELRLHKAKLYSLRVG